jgi:hypothetical protein
MSSSFGASPVASVHCPALAHPGGRGCSPAVLARRGHPGKAADEAKSGMGEAPGAGPLRSPAGADPAAG